MLFAHTQDERRACACANDAVGFVFVENSNRIRTVQLQNSGFDGVKHIAVVEAFDQVGNDLGVGLAQELVAFGLQRSA